MASKLFSKSTPAPVLEPVQESKPTEKGFMTYFGDGASEWGEELISYNSSH